MSDKYALTCRTKEPVWVLACDSSAQRGEEGELFVKKVLGIIAATALAASALAAPAIAGDKVELCHVNGSTGAAPFPPTESIVIITYGRVVEVSANAVDAHIAHGDGPVQHTPANNPLVWVYGEGFGVAGNSNCAFNIPIA